MRSGWKKATLGDVCEITSSKRIFAKEYRTIGIPFYRGKEIIEKQKGSSISTELFIDESRYTDIKKRFGCPEKGDILLTSVGTLGIPYVVKNEQFYFKDGNLTWLRNFRDADSAFLCYWILSPTGKYQIDTKCIGSTQKALTIETLLRFTLQLPSLTEQRSIAATLSCLDDKIELNNKICANLEAQAQAIHVGMFGLREKAGQLKGICSFSNSRIDVESLTVETYISTENMIPNKSGITSATNLPTAPKTVKYVKGDVLISNIRPYFKKIWYCYNTGGCSNDVLCFSPSSTKMSAYLYCTLFADKFFDYMVAGSKGTKMPRGDKLQIMNYPIYIPTNNEIENFADIIEPILAHKQLLATQSRVLATLRDTLLPGLMNGEIEVPVEAE